jgi:hypothetical protein
VLDNKSRLSATVFLDGDGTLDGKAGNLNHAKRFRMVPFVAEHFREAADWILRQQE